nr:glycosyltransferase family 4 protein [Gramella crocea]
MEISKNFKEIVPVFVHIYSENALKNDFLKNKIKVHSLNLPGSWNLKLAQERLKKIYDLEQPDIIHATLFRSEIVTRRLKKYYPHIPLVNSFVSDSYSQEKFEEYNFLRKFKGRLIQLWDRNTVSKVDYFISNSETIKFSMCKALNIPPKKVKVIYRGRDVKKLSRFFDSEISNAIIDEYNLQGKTILINVGRLIKTKGQADIIEIMPHLLNSFPNIVLLVAGEGNRRRELEEMIQEKGLKDKVFLLGNRSDVPELLSLSDVFIFPTYLEGLPGALIEAMISNTVICTSNIPVNLECIDETSAVIFEVGNRKDMLEKISFAISNLPRLEERSEKAFKIASEKFNIELISQVYEDFYRTAIKTNIDQMKDK